MAYKYVLPAIWVPMWGAATIASWLRELPGQDLLPELPPGLPIKWFMLITLILGIGSIYKWCISLKYVLLRDDNLVVSNYLRETSVPLSEVARISENRWVNIRPITIYFRNETMFGKSATFMPRARWLFPWQTNPDLLELRLKCFGRHGA